MREERLLRLLLALSIVIFACHSANAQTTNLPETLPNQSTSEPISEKNAKTTSVLQNLYAQWHQEHPQDAKTVSDFRNYLLSKRVNNSELGQTQYNAFSKSFYQPFFVLSNGAWIMGFEEKQGSISVFVDVNGPSAPGFRGSDEIFDQKEFLINNQGQVTQILN